MTADIPEEFVVMKGQILDGMVDYLEVSGDEGFKADYSAEAVDRCAVILERYLDEVLSLSIYGDSGKIMRMVKSVVTELNELNDACNQSLIEPEQSAQLYELIVSAAFHAGLETDEQDITEQWRQW